MRSIAGTATIDETAGTYAFVPTPVTPAPIPDPPPPPPSAFGVKVSGNAFTDMGGNKIQLRGVNVAGLEETYVSTNQWAGNNPWGNGNWPVTGPPLDKIKAWKANIVRYPLNEASWLGLTVYSANTGASRKADPYGDYQAKVKASVKAATDAGLCVILDLHCNCPDDIPANGGITTKVPIAPIAQTPMADADHSYAFWTDIANTFKDNPAVLFELFNEPYFWWIQPGADPWQVLRDGGILTQYNTNENPLWQKALNWQTAGTQKMLDAIRATGATNVCIAPGLSWTGDLQKAVTWLPVDPIGQLAQAWHCYPNSVHPDQPGLGTVQYTYAESMLTAGHPVIVTETGEHNAPGTIGAPLMGNLLPWADKNGVSVLGWTFNPWGTNDNTLLKHDNTVTPSDGFGIAFYNWLVNHA